MAKSKNEVTSAKAASAAARVLGNKKSSKDAKTAAGSALTQSAGKKKINNQHNTEESGKPGSFTDLSQVFANLSGHSSRAVVHAARQLN